MLQGLLGSRDGDLVALRTRLAAELRAGMADEPERAAEIWPALMELVRTDLSISKPGHDSWVGE